MRLLYMVAVLVVGCVQSSLANGLCGSNPNFVFSNVAEAIPPQSITWDIHDLPQEVVALLRQNDFFLGHRGEESVARGYIYDLNNDNSQEYLIEIPAWSGSGGTSYIILTFLSERWIDIGTSEGSFIPLASWVMDGTNRWGDFGSYWKAGYDEYLRVTYHYDRNKRKYVKTEGIMCKRGKVTK